MSAPVNNGSPPSADELRAGIAETRQALSATMEALAAKTDVKARASDFAQETGERARLAAREHRTQLIALGIAALAAVAAVIVWQRRSSSEQWF
ncbi:MAG: DUF3618 domain-containing protein [Hamadaea sp.]|nr:DUF3618 domain-containing protein [Hamadaea sp.]